MKESEMKSFTGSPSPFTEAGTCVGIGSCWSLESEGSGAGNGVVTEVIQMSDVIAICLHCLDLLYTEPTGWNYWTFDLNRLTCLSFEILRSC